MAFIVKSLAYGQLTSTSDTNLYPEGSGTFATKAAVVKNMRFVNTGSSAATLLLKVKRDTPSDTRRLTAGPVTIPPKGLLIIDDELTLEGNSASGTERYAILGATSSGGTLDYVISGLEREVV